MNMTNPTGAFPDETYAEGLLHADERVIQQIYVEFRRPFRQTLSSLGVSAAETGRLFQAAIVETTRMAQAGTLPVDRPYYEVLESLAVWHLRYKAALQASKEREDLEPPEPSALSGTITSIESWKHTRPNLDEPLPPGFAVWQIVLDLERHLATERPEISPPESFMSDRRLRYAADEDSSQARLQNNDCERLIQESDQLYQDGQFEAAQEPLLLLVLDSAGACQSDGWYFLSLLRLELGDPATAIECLTKIEDLDHYGDDIQWYMAVSLLQLSASEPSVRDKAVRALQRVMDSTTSEDRKVKAGKMLEQLK
jgi:tetratricopeptide (TPR) repeat protein